MIGAVVPRVRLGQIDLRIYLMGLVIFGGLFLLGIPVHANDSLTDVFQTKSFAGSWEVVNKFNWLGWGMSFIISTFCLFGLFMTMFSRITSILYLAGRNTFDDIYTMKNAAKGSAMFGFGNMAKETYRSNYGAGFDALVGFLYMLIPNVKAYSDYGRDNMSYNLSEDDSILTYMLKTAIPTILLTFFFTIGFSGTLFKGYGVVVDAMAVVADQAVTTNLAATINKVLNTGESYKFTIGGPETGQAKLAQDFSQDLYGRVLSRMDVIDTGSRIAIGQNVETYVWENLLGGKYGDYSKLNDIVSKSSGNVGKSNGQNKIASDTDASQVSFNIVVNNNAKMNASGMDIPLAKLVSGVAEESKTNGGALYAHVFMHKNKLGSANFFALPEKKQ